MIVPDVRKQLGSWLRYYGLLLAGWVAAFLFFRLVLVAGTWSLRGDAPAGMVAESFLHGLRFDFSMAVRLGAVFALWRLWRPALGIWERRMFLGLHSLVVVLAFFVMTAEVEYYKEFQMRLGPLAIEYFGKPEHNEIVLGMIWHGYPVVRWTLFCLGMAALAAWGTRAQLGRNLVPGRWPGGLAGVVVLAGVTVVLSRGGLQGDPLRWGDAFFSPNTYANHMAQNGVFALVDTVRAAGRTRKADIWARALPYTNAVAAAREAILLPGETLVEPDQYPLLRRSPPGRAPLRQRPRNVVLVIMESFSARFVGATGAPFGATPNFDALAREGILFDRAFSVSTHTAQGVFGTLCAFPNLPEFDGVMKHPLGGQPFRALPRVMQEAGFSTLFLYNGLFSWDNKEGFFRHQGVGRFIGRDDYVKPTFVDPDWGVSDLDVFLRALEELDAEAAAHRRFLGLILTLSNHAPFNLPKIEGLPWLETGGDQNKRVNGVHYADWALGQFMQRARTRRWFQDTLFVFVGDHGFGIPPVLTRAGVLHQHVPLLFYGPGVLGETGSVRHVTASQLDILPTVSGLAGLEVPHQAFGRDLFALPPDDPGRAYLKASGSSIVGYVEGRHVLTLMPGKPPELQTIDLSFPPSASENLAAREPERTARMERQLKGLIVTGLRTLQDHRAGRAMPEKAAGTAAGP